MKRSVIWTFCLAGCASAQTTTSPVISFPTVPKGTAVYSGSLAKTTRTSATTTDRNDLVVAYTEVQTFGGTINLAANFDTGLLNARVTNPSSDFARSSTQSTEDNYNFIEEASYSGAVSGIGTIVGTSFTSGLSGNLTQTSLDRSPVSGASPEAFTGTVAGQVSGANVSTATGTLNLGRTQSGPSIPFFTDLGFFAPQN